MHPRRLPGCRLLAGLLTACAVSGCDSTTDTIGRGNAVATASATSTAMPSATPTAMPTDMPSAMPTDMPPDTPPPEKPSLKPLPRPQEYPNPFHDLLGKTSDEIDKLVNDAFKQLFHGADDEVIYFLEDDDAASIRDILHTKEVRSEGMGLGMMIAVELGKKDEFDKLWTYARRDYVDFKTGGLRFATGANEGYFNSHCDGATGPTVTCVDPYGMENFTTALIFAHDLWGDAGTLDYEADALALLDVMKNKEEMNGGIVEKVTNMFDSETHLALDTPKSPAAQTRPSVLMPAYYSLWAQATGDKYWLDTAQAARDFFPTVASTKTGLMPQRAYFDGLPVPGSDTANAEAFRVFINLTLDEIWTGGNPSGVSACNQVLSFFSDIGIDKYVGTYDLDGKPLSTGRETSLVVVNGISATISKNADRKDYIKAVWDQDLVTGNNRYYTGILQLFGFLVLSGKMQVL